jgi:hypothetical protein
VGSEKYSERIQIENLVFQPKFELIKLTEKCQKTGVISWVNFCFTNAL